MMKAPRFFPSIRYHRIWWNDGGRRFSRSGGDSNRKKKAIMAALSPDAPVAKTSKRMVRTKPETSTKKAPKASQPKADPLSFFDEVDFFLEKEKGRSFGNPANTRPQDTANPARDETMETAPSSPKWTSYLRSDGKTASPKKSIFDVFKVPDPAPERSEFAFDSNAYDDYVAILDNACNEDDESGGSSLTVEMKADVEEWLRLDEPKISVELPVFTQICEQGIENMERETKGGKLLKEQARDELMKQAKVFKEKLGWNEQQYTYATFLIHEIAKLSCKNHKALPVIVIFEKMKEAGYVQKKTLLAQCLKASTSFSGGSLSRGRSILGSPLSSQSRLYDILEGKESRKDFTAASDDGEDIANLPEQLASANDLFYEPTHHSTTIRTKRLISLGNADGALELIESSTDGEAKLRGYSQVFSLYLELGNITSAMILFEKMKKNHDVVAIEPEMFVQLIAAIAERGYFCHGSKAIGAAAPTSGPALFDHLAQEMSEYVYSISSASAKRLQKAFKRGFEETGSSDGDNISSLAPLKPLKDEKVPEQVLIADRVTVESSTGFCTCSNASLRLIGLEPHQKEEMKDSIVNIVRQRRNRDVKALLSFWDWMRNRTGRPYTVIIDGANVAYYMQNFDRGKFNFHQIEFAVTALEGIGEHPLVILPRRYQNDTFNVTLGQKKQKATASEKSIIRDLKASEKLYLVPQGYLDDYFWLLASVSDQSSCQAVALKDSQTENKTQWPGTRPVVMTNDQIRDHQQFQFLRPRLFNRWYSSTIMNYNFTGFVSDECVDPEIAFTPADVYSREIQGNIATADGNTTWHFPVQDWDTTDWFCVRLPERKSLVEL